MVGSKSRKEKGRKEGRGSVVGKLSQKTSKSAMEDGKNHSFCSSHIVPTSRDGGFPFEDAQNYAKKTVVHCKLNNNFNSTSFIEKIDEWEVS